MGNKSLPEMLKILATGGVAADALLDLLQKELSLPNIPTPTMGGRTFWTTLAEYRGWRLQQNTITKHCRILNAEDIRIAWGTKNGMIKALDTMIELQDKYK